MVSRKLGPLKKTKTSAPKTDGSALNRNSSAMSIPKTIANPIKKQVTEIVKGKSPLMKRRVKSIAKPNSLVNANTAVVNEVEIAS